MELPENVKGYLQDPAKIKTITTIDREGMPHSVPINSTVVLEDGTIAFMELLETSNTQKNMLNCYWFEKDVCILVVDDWGKGSIYQIKCTPYKFLTEGPIWEQFLDEVWKILPDSDPAGVWLLKPKEIRNQNYFERKKAEEERRANAKIWLRYKGARS